MSLPSMNDSPEHASLSPAESVSDRRKRRDEEDYRDRCEAEFEIICLGDDEFHPADVLEKLAPDSAKRGRSEAFEQIRAETEEIVCEQFPATIAVPFHRFLQGNPQPLRRLYHLRDTWEAMVRLLSSLALAQAAKCLTAKKLLQFRHNNSEGTRECKRKDLYSDKMATRIGFLEGVMAMAKNGDIKPGLIGLIPPDIPAEMRRLNIVRNGFSHESAKSDTQSEQLIKESYPILREVFVDLRDLRAVELFRIEALRPGTDGGTAQVERFAGHAQSQQFSDWNCNSAEISQLSQAGTTGDLHRILARFNNDYLDLSPFLYSREDESGHRTKLLEFKQHKQGLWELECVADSKTESFDGAVHLSFLDRFSLMTKDGGNHAPN